MKNLKEVINTSHVITYELLKLMINLDIHESYDWTGTAILGTGRNGAVRLCIHRKTGVQYAVKTLKKNQVKNDDIDTLKQEIRFMADLDHPNILRIYEYYETADNLYLILELCSGGELLSHLERRSYFPENTVRYLIYSILRSVRYCHDHSIVHRDLKLQNFLFDSKLPTSDLKLIDFGLSQYLETGHSLQTPVGTPFYVAPEILNKSYDSKCDIWSIGIITYMLFSGIAPFYGPTDVDTLKAVQEGNLKFNHRAFDMASPAAMDFIKVCLTRDVSQRPSAKEALTHIWFHPFTTNIEEVNQKIISNIKLFSKRQILSKITLKIVAHTLTSHQLTFYKKEFNKFDLDLNGEISLENFMKVFSTETSESYDEIKYLFENVMPEKLNRIRYREFVAASLAKEDIKNENIMIAFEILTRNRPVFTKWDIVELLGIDGSTFDVEAMLKSCGLPHDIEIGFEEVGYCRL